MKERLLTGWTIQRGLYVIIGGILITQSIMEAQWIGMAIGGYFASMGIFAFGCAAGNCGIPSSPAANRKVFSDDSADSTSSV